MPADVEQAAEREPHERRYRRRHLLAAAGIGVATSAVTGGPLNVLASPLGFTSKPKTSASETAPGATAVGPRLPILRAPAQTTPGTSYQNLTGNDPVWHLLRRATFGPTPALVDEVRAKGISAWLDEQLNPAAIDDSACDDYLKRYPSLPMTTMQIRAAYPKFGWDPMMELCFATIARALWSKRQLFEVMVEFWSNHFNVATPSGEVWDLKTVEDREVIRKHALGKFTDLLIADAKSAAMGLYLDNANSSVDSLNENYGRELLELHTVGIEAGYSQTDVVNSARLMTGYTVGRHGEFAYYNDWRYLGPVKVLDFSHPNSDDFDGRFVAEQYLSYLAHHPSTARHLATKLVTRFVADDPPASLIDKLSQVYLDSDTAIVPVLKALFTSSEFANSFGQKTRRPIEDTIGVARSIGVAPADGTSKSLAGVYYALSNLGQAPLGWPAPNGYPDVTNAWMSTSGLLGRWNTHVGLLDGWWKDGMTSPAVSTLLNGQTPANNGALVDALAIRLIGVPLVDPQRSAIVNFLNSQSTNVANNIKWNLSITAALVLDTPNWIQR